MSEHKQAARSRSRQTEDTEAQAADLRDDKLDEAVECCLADIDDALDEAKSEEDEARAEYDKIVARFEERKEEAFRRWQNAENDEAKYDAYWAASAAETDAEDELRRLQARYGHLGLEIGICCGEPYFMRSDS